VLARQGAQVLAVESGLTGGLGQVASHAREDVPKVVVLEDIEQGLLGFREGQVRAQCHLGAGALGLQGQAQLLEGVRSRCEHERPLQDVAQLAHVARPVLMSARSGGTQAIADAQV
jgi:hypothetical protein